MTAEGTAASPRPNLKGQLSSGLRVISTPTWRPATSLMAKPSLAGAGRWSRWPWKRPRGSLSELGRLFKDGGNVTEHVGVGHGWGQGDCRGTRLLQGETGCRTDRGHARCRVNMSSVLCDFYSDHSKSDVTTKAEAEATAGLACSEFPRCPPGDPALTRASREGGQAGATENPREGLGTPDAWAPQARPRHQREAEEWLARWARPSLKDPLARPPQARVCERTPRAPSRPLGGPARAPAHLGLKRVIRDIFQVDEHVEIGTKHTCLQGLGCHLQQPPGRAASGMGCVASCALPTPQPRVTGWGLRPHVKRK